MLEMRPGCECCDKDLPANAVGAFVCSFECTFCEACASTTLKGNCPNCGGALVARPLRTGAMLAKYPADAHRTVKAAGCTPA